MEEMLPWGTLRNVDSKLQRESEASSIFYSWLFHLKIICKETCFQK